MPDPGGRRVQDNGVGEVEGDWGVKGRWTMIRKYVLACLQEVGDETR